MFHSHFGKWRFIYPAAVLSPLTFISSVCFSSHTVWLCCVCLSCLQNPANKQRLISLQHDFDHWIIEFSTLVSIMLHVTRCPHMSQNSKIGDLSYVMVWSVIILWDIGAVSNYTSMNNEYERKFTVYFHNLMKIICDIKRECNLFENYKCVLAEKICGDPKAK